MKCRKQGFKNRDTGVLEEKNVVGDIITDLRAGLVSKS